MESSINTYCSKGSISTFLCVSRNCKSHPFTCSDEDCDCHSHHLECPEQYQTPQFLSNLVAQSKRNHEIMYPVIQYYDILIKTLVIEKGELEERVETMGIEGGMEKDELEIYKCFKTRNSVELTGREAERIVTRWEENKSKKFESYQRIVGNQLKRVKKEFESALTSLKQIISTTATTMNLRKSKLIFESKQILKQAIKQNDRDLLALIRSCKIREIKVNNQDIPRDSESIQLKKITSLSLQHITFAVVQLLSQHCPKLQRLLIQSGVSDEICNSLSVNMLNLKQLIILRSSVTDVGGVQLASSLQQLDCLQLTHNNITDHGRKMIRTLFPKSKTLRF